jgi:hypothetical protein
MRRVVAPNTEVFTFTPFELHGSSDNYFEMLQQHKVIKSTIVFPTSDYRYNKYTSQCCIPNGSFPNNIQNINKIFITDFELFEAVENLYLRFSINGENVGIWSFALNSEGEFLLPIGDNKETVSILLTHAELSPSNHQIRPYAHCNFIPTFLGPFTDKVLSFFTICKRGLERPVKCGFRLRIERLYFSNAVWNILWKNSWTTFTVRSLLGKKLVYSMGHGGLNLVDKSPRDFRKNMQESYHPQAYYSIDKPNIKYLEQFHTVRQTCKIVPSKTIMKSAL